MEASPVSHISRKQLEFSPTAPRGGENLCPNSPQNKTPSTATSDRGSWTYDAQKVLGSGSFGTVYAAIVNETGEQVAIKKVLQDKRYKNRELQIMKGLRHPNVVELKHAFYTEKSGETYLNLVMEYCSDTVHRVIRNYAKQRQYVPESLVQLLSYQMCRGCTYMHAVGICHRDIKPQNILVDSRTNALKFCDFGSAKALQKGEPNVAYISSRYYRAPELIFGATEYDTKIDIWSSACVVAEMMLGTPLFAGEESNVAQLVEIIKILGTPTREQVTAMNPNYQEFQFRQIKPQHWRKVFRSTASKEAVSFIATLLVYVPSERPTGLECCAHAFFDGLRAAGGAAGKAPDNLFDFSKEERSLMSADMRARLAPSASSPPAR